MFTGSSTVERLLSHMFVVLLARGISWVNMGKTKQNKTKKSGKSLSLTLMLFGSHYTDFIWIYFYLSGCLFAVGSIWNFSSCSTYHPFHPHQWLNAWLLHEQELSLTSILNAYGYSICHFNVDYYLSLCRTFTQADYWLCLSISHLPLHFMFPYLLKTFALPPPASAFAPLCWCSWRELRLYVSSPASAQERPQRRVTGPTGKPRGRFTSHTFVTTNRAQQGVASEQRTSNIHSTAAHQQAPAVAEPPAAVLSGQHEGEGLAVGKDHNI